MVRGSRMQTRKKRFSTNNDQKNIHSIETDLQAYCAEHLRQRLSEEDLSLTEETLNDTAERYASRLLSVIVMSANNMIEDDMSNIMKLLGRRKEK